MKQSRAIIFSKGGYGQGGIEILNLSKSYPPPLKLLHGCDFLSVICFFVFVIVSKKKKKKDKKDF